MTREKIECKFLIEGVEWTMFVYGEGVTSAVAKRNARRFAKRRVKEQRGEMIASG